MLLTADYLSKLYQGLFSRARAFASFKEKEELDVIWEDLRTELSNNDVILDPMSGYGGCMRYFGNKGYQTHNIEINPPSYFWQYLINPEHCELIQNAIQVWKQHIQTLRVSEILYVVSDELFTQDSANIVCQLYQWMLKKVQNQEVVLSVLLPFVSRFATYQHNDHNITSVTKGGFAMLSGWKADFQAYLQLVEHFLAKEYNRYQEVHHQTILSDWMSIDLDKSFKFFVTSPPYPNYRDYAKIFGIENHFLESILKIDTYNHTNMIGSNVVKKKEYGVIESAVANRFFDKLSAKSLKLKAKSRNDIKVYYLPYFKLYFYNMQEAFRKLADCLTREARGYVVVNDNITRDIPIPVGEFVCEIFEKFGFHAEDIETTHVHHWGNINHNAKRINSLHVHHIIKVWR